jgi:hypothetical protein
VGRAYAKLLRAAIIISSLAETREDLTMAIEHTHIRTLIDKLQALPPERIAEVEDFIDFLKERDYLMRRKASSFRSCHYPNQLHL